VREEEGGSSKKKKVEEKRRKNLKKNGKWGCPSNGEAFCRWKTNRRTFRYKQYIKSRTKKGRFWEIKKTNPRKKKGGIGREGLTRGWPSIKGDFYARCPEREMEEKDASHHKKSGVIC